VLETVAGLLGVPVCLPVAAEHTPQTNLSVKLLNFNAPFREEFVPALSRS